VAPIAAAVTALVDPSRYRWIAAATRLRAGRPVQPARYHALRAASYAGVRGKRILVAGCNRGEDCRWFVELGARRVDGIDVIDDIGSEFQHPDVHYHRVSVEDLPFGEEFDLSYSHATLEHVPRVDLAIPELVRVLKVGGVTYNLAAPLWNSSQGHHKSDLFEGYPWIHLRMSRDEIVAFAHREQIRDPAGTSIEAHVDYMLNPEFFNMTPASTYLEAANSLRGVELIKNVILPEPDAGLSDDLASELAEKGYSRAELLSGAHLLVARKLQPGSQ
jgi:SAM-dependent methyltransferase